MTSIRLDLAGAGRSVAENIELARQAEQAGWQGFWVSEINGMDAVTVASSVGAVLQTGRLGTAILPFQTRDPLLMAMTAATLDTVCAGGFVLGLGTSTKLIIEDWHATPWGDSPLALVREAVSLTRQFLDGERVTTEQGRWRYRRAQMGLRPLRRIPIYLAALNDRMLELAGEIADGVMLNFVTVEDVVHARERMAVGAARAGRAVDELELMVYFRATVTDDYETVRERYQRELLTYVMAPVYQQMFARQGQGDDCAAIQKLWQAKQREEALARIPPALIRERTLIGSASEIADQLARYEAAGVNATQIIPVPTPGLDHVTECVHTIESLGAAVAS